MDKAQESIVVAALARFLSHVLVFLPYMGMVAILVMWPGPFEQTFVPPSIGPVVSEENMFENVDGPTDDRRRTPESLVY